MIAFLSVRPSVGSGALKDRVVMKDYGTPNEKMMFTPFRGKRCMSICDDDDDGDDNDDDGNAGVGKDEMKVYDELAKKCVSRQIVVDLFFGAKVCNSSLSL